MVPEDFVWLAIDKLKKDDLIITDEPLHRFPSIKRRELIKQVGLAAAIALPLATSIAAPSAVNAASVCAFATDLPPPVCGPVVTYNFGCASSQAECFGNVAAVKA